MEIIVKDGTVRWLEKDGYGKKKVWEANAERLYKLLKEHFESKPEEKKDTAAEEPRKRKKE